MDLANGVFMGEIDSSNTFVFFCCAVDSSHRRPSPFIAWPRGQIQAQLNLVQGQLDMAACNQLSHSPAVGVIGEV